MAQIPLSDEAREARIVQMVRLYEKELLRLCFLYLHDVEPARDMVQETFLRAYAHLDELQDEEKGQFWLRKIAINLCRDYLRSGWVRHMNRFVLPEELPLAADPPDESSVLLITAMLNLPPKSSEVLHTISNRRFVNLLIGSLC